MEHDPRIDPAELRNARFPGNSRRYDAKAVDRFLADLAARIVATNELVDQLIARAEAAEAAPPPPQLPPPDLSSLTDDELLALVGEETATVLASARRAADDIRSKAEASAARVIREATTEAKETIDSARDRVVELTAEAEHARDDAVAKAEAEAERIRQDAERDAHRMLAEAREQARVELESVERKRTEAADEAAATLVEAREQGRAMVAEAKETRGRILDDLQRRRDAARVQIERLREGRSRLLEAYASVRANLDEITGELRDAFPESPSTDDADDHAVGTDVVPPLDEAEVESFAGDVAAGRDPDLPFDQDLDDAPLDDTNLDDTVPDDDTVLDEPALDDTAPDDPGLDDHVPDDTVPDDTALDDTAALDVAAPDDTVPDDTALDDTALDDTAPDDMVVAAPDDEPAAPAPATGPFGLSADVADDTDPADDPGGGVDALFARIRAERAESVAKAHEVLESVAADGSPGESGEPAPVVDVDEAGALAAVASVDQVSVDLLADPSLVEARSEALAPIESSLGRALKRHLADEQNGVLDALRQVETATLDDLFPPLDEHVAGYARLAAPLLNEAAAAGTASTGSGSIAPEAVARVDVDALAGELGAAVVEPFRRRVERSVAVVEGDAGDLDERLRALYREWKVQHVGPVITDAVLSAHGRGAVAGAAEGQHFRWLIDPSQGPCPDAQDNALAGAVVAGEALPTGDVCPQAHPGCRCLLAPA